MTAEDIKQLDISYDKAVVIFDAVAMLGAEANKTLLDTDDLIAPLKREALATVNICKEIADQINIEFNFGQNIDEDEFI